jgi:hypothetical protein
MLPVGKLSLLATIMYVLVGLYGDAHKRFFLFICMYDDLDIELTSSKQKISKKSSV